MKAVPSHPVAESVVELLFVGESSSESAVLSEPRGHLVRNYDRAELIHLSTMLARGMSATNLRRGSPVALFCHSSARAVAMCFANLINGAVNVVVPADSQVDEILHALATSRAEALVVDHIEAALPVLRNIKNLPQLRQILVLNDAEFERQPEILCTGWQEILARGEKQADRTTLLRQAVTASHEAFLYFQRDAEKRLKGRMYTHGEMLAHLSEINASLPSTKELRILGLVPFHYPQSFLALALLPLITGYTCKLYLPEESWKIEGRSHRKTLLAATAGFFETLHHRLKTEYEHGGWLSRMAWQHLQQRGEAEPPAEGVARKIYHWQGLLLGKALGSLPHDLMGGTIQAVMAVDAPLTTPCRIFLQGMGVHLLPAPQIEPAMLESRIEAS